MMFWFFPLGILGVLLMIAMMIGGAAVYFIPTFIALARRQKNLLSIFILNLFLGWSVVGWVIALVWALKVE